MNKNNGKRRKSGSVQRTAAGPFVYLPVCFRTRPGVFWFFKQTESVWRGHYRLCSKPEHTMYTQKEKQNEMQLYTALCWVLYTLSEHRTVKKRRRQISATVQMKMNLDCETVTISLYHLDIYLLWRANLSLSQVMLGISLQRAECNPWYNGSFCINPPCQQSRNHLNVCQKMSLQT